MDVLPAFVVLLAAADNKLALLYGHIELIADETRDRQGNAQPFRTVPVTGNALWVTAKIMFFSFIVQAPISLLLGVFTSASQKYRAALAVLYFMPLLLSSAAVAIALARLCAPGSAISSTPISGCSSHHR